jgi:hypothetical protein
MENLNVANFASVMQKGQKGSLSKRYNHVNSMAIVNLICSHGWEVKDVQESRAIKDANKGFQKHMITFRKPNVDLDNVGDTAPQIVFTGSHDGSSSNAILAGIFRKVCSNGLIVSESEFSAHKIRHVGNNRDQVVDAVFHVVKNVPLLAEKVDTWRGTDLNQNDKLAFAESASLLRWDENRKPEPSELLTLTRHEDRKDDLFTVFNVIQENIMKGGVKVPNKPELVDEELWRYKSTGFRKSKKVSSVPETVRLNKALWTLTEAMAKHKA